jgi:hypothetical protein
VVFTLGTSAVGAAGRFYTEAPGRGAAGVRAVLLTGGFAQNVPDGPASPDVLLDRAPHQLLFRARRRFTRQRGRQDRPAPGTR